MRQLWVCEIYGYAWDILSNMWTMNYSPWTHYYHLFKLDYTWKNTSHIPPINTRMKKYLHIPKNMNVYKSWGIYFWFLSPISINDSKYATSPCMLFSFLFSTTELFQCMVCMSLIYGIQLAINALIHIPVAIAHI